MKFNAMKFSSIELEVIINQCQKAIAFRHDLEKLLDATDLTVGDMKYLKPRNVMVKSGAKKGTKVAPKWRHKDAGSNLTWSGRGLTPKWVKKFGVKV